MASERITVELEVNGQLREVEVAVGDRLLDLLRDELGLTGAKEGCGRGECGACTVLLDERPVNACMVPAFQAAGRSVVTVEGLGRPGRPGAVQQAFVRQAAVQCGYCTPGVIMSAKALLNKYPQPTEEQINAGMAGVLCRCTGHIKVKQAIRSVAAARKRRA